jgi:hypothetical protein
MMVVQSQGEEHEDIHFRHTPQSASTGVTQAHHDFVEGAGFEAFKIQEQQKCKPHLYRTEPLE